MTNSDLTHLVLVLDRSGSMGDGGKAAEAEKGVRTLLDEQTAVPGQLEVTVVRFDDQYEMVASAVPATTVSSEELRIVPRGMTALFDAVGKTIDMVGQVLRHCHERDRPGRVIFLVATDGLENASRRYNALQLRRLIEQQTNTYGWEFIFMGTSEDAVLQAQSAGFSYNMSYASTDSAVGVQSAYATASSSITRGRLKGASITVSDEDRTNLR